MKGEIIFIVILILFVAQFFLGAVLNPESEFSGADSQAEEVINEVTGGYEPFEPDVPKFEPPGGETESLLFALQAAIGAIIIGYFFGYYHGKAQAKK